MKKLGSIAAKVVCAPLVFIALFYQFAKPALCAAFVAGVGWLLGFEVGKAFLFLTSTASLLWVSALISSRVYAIPMSTFVPAPKVTQTFDVSGPDKDSDFKSKKPRTHKVRSSNDKGEYSPMTYSRDESLSLADSLSGIA